MPMLTNLRQQLRDSGQSISNYLQNLSACISVLWQRIESCVWPHKKWIPFVVVVIVALPVTTFMPSDCTGFLGYVCCFLGVEDKATVVRYLGFLAAGALSFAGVVIAGHRSQAMTDAVKATTAGQQQERFRDAIAHLGHERASVRQGGAHALFHLALDEERLRASIAEILCAHIRETTQNKDYQDKYANNPSTEVQSLLALLFVRERRDGEDRQLDSFWKGIRPNLAGCYFRGVELVMSRFYGADLRGVQFQEARLIKAQFQGSELIAAHFQGAWLHEAQFQGAWLDIGQFLGAWLRGAKFQGTRLSEAQFQGAWLHEAQFQGALLDKAQFQAAVLDKAQFHGAFSGGIEYRIPYSYEALIRDRVKCPPKLGAVIFSGGLKDEQVKKMKAELKIYGLYFNEDREEKFEEEIKIHISETVGHELPEFAIGGKYSERDAEKWIREYKAAMGELPNS